MSILTSLSNFIGNLSRAPSTRFTAVILVVWIPANLLNRLMIRLGGPDFDFSLDTPIKVIHALLAAPLIETLLMKYAFRLGSRRIADPVVLNTVCALLWGAIHLAAPGFGIYAVWAFFVLGACYQELAKRNEAYAFINVAIVHGACNAVTYLQTLISHVW